MGTFTWPPARTYTWPSARTFPWPWTLDAGFGAGLIIVHGQKQAGAHEPVITQDEWGAYLRVRALRKPLRSYERQDYLLTDMVRCFCGAELTIRTNGVASAPRFICARRASTHHGANVGVGVVDAAAFGWLGRVTKEPQEMLSADFKSRAKARQRKQDARRIAKELSALDIRWSALRVPSGSRLDPAAAGSAAASQISSRGTALMQELRRAQRDAQRIDPVAVARALVQDWDELSIQLRRDPLQQLIDHVSVTPGRPRSIVTIVPTWQV
jgi:site-specific DNA recombinase